MSETTIEVEYCVPCGFLGRAIDVSEALLGALGGEVDRVSLVTGDHGVFEVRVDGETVFDKEEDAYDVDEIVRAARAELS